MSVFWKWNILHQVEHEALLNPYFPFQKDASNDKLLILQHRPIEFYMAGS